MSIVAGPGSIHVRRRPPPLAGLAVSRLYESVGQRLDPYALGHGLADGYVVARSGCLYHQRQALATDDVIGWTFRATWFQRRAGLTSLVATTAGGPQSVTILDVPEDAAVALASTAIPALVGQFTHPTATGQ